MRRTGFDPETHRTGTGAADLGGPFFRLDQLRAQGQPEIIVGIHFDELLLTFAVEQISWSSTLPGLQNPDDDGFRTLGCATGLQIFDCRGQGLVKALHRHGLGLLYRRAGRRV